MHLPKFMSRMPNSNQKEHNFAISSEFKEHTAYDPVLFFQAMNLGFADTTLRQISSNLSGRHEIRRDPRKCDKFKTISNIVDLFFDSEGIVLKEFVPPGQAMYGNYYCDDPRLLRKTSSANVQWHNSSWVLHHDYPPAYISPLLWELSTSTKTAVIPHLPYLPDHTPTEFFPISQNEIEV
jgi:hypothetical protein